jgi:hypothetical protein
VGCDRPRPRARLRLVSPLDGVTLEALCATYARWKRHDGSHGYAALTNVLAELARDVGLAPAASQRMAAPASDPGEKHAVFGGPRSFVLGEVADTFVAARIQGMVGVPRASEGRVDVTQQSYACSIHSSLRS